MIPAQGEGSATTNAESRSPFSAATERRYIQMTARMTRVTGAGAFAIASLVTISAVGNPRLLLVLSGIQAAQIVFNVWVNLWLLKRIGVSRAESLRMGVNLTLAAVLGHLAQWPVPVWLWLPYTALAFEHVDARISRTVVVASLGVFVTLGIVDGVPWIRPVAFTVFTVFCVWIAALRVRELAEMLVQADIHGSELERAHRELRAAHENLTRETKARELAEVELRQAQKLEAVGRLAAGVAHEINTPVQFVSDNLRFSKDAVVDLLALLGTYQGLTHRESDDATLEHAIERARVAEQALDTAFLADELPSALDKSLEGMARIASIVRSMTHFAQRDQREMSAVDLNDAVTSVLAVLRSEYENVASVELSLGALPTVLCNAAEINEVVLALIVNAAHAIADTPKGARGAGRIAVRTACEPGSKFVVLSVTDDGTGIPSAVQQRIFEPFFTTKAVGKGVGQGLAAARAVVQRHGGTITFESVEGAGTTFWVKLPVYEAREDPNGGVRSGRFGARFRSSARAYVLECEQKGGRE